MSPRCMFVAFFIIVLCIFPSGFGRTCEKHSEARRKHHHHHHHHHHGHAKRPVRPIPTLNNQASLLNVEAFGAKADNISDNSQAFRKAWDTACNSINTVTLLVPNKTYYVKHVNFTGPCKSKITFQIQGIIKSFPQMYDIPKKLWIKFEGVTSMEIFGGGKIDGNGAVWWNNSCKRKITKPCQSQSAPTALTFKNCSNLILNNLHLLDAQQMHVNFEDCNFVEASKLLVTAPEDSPNTDGIHVTRTTNIIIRDSIIGTGDDCISIVNGSRNVGVKDIDCGPGHGISIGSLGEDNTENHVSDISVSRVRLTGTTNGVRIKSWQGGSGVASNIMFEDIMMKNVYNPIIINQYYCDKNKSCDKEISAVQVENIVYRNIRGTSASKVAINFNCSQSVPCRNLTLENVKLRSEVEGEKVEAYCSQLAMQSVRQNFTPSC